MVSLLDNNCFIEGGRGGGGGGRIQTSVDFRLFHAITVLCLSCTDKLSIKWRENFH